jgi:hypothetical protein
MIFSLQNATLPLVSKIENTFKAFLDHIEREQNTKVRFSYKNFIRRLNEQKTVFWPYFDCLGETATPLWILTAEN